MKLSTSFLNPIRATRNGGIASLTFLCRRRSSGGGSQPSSTSFKRRGGGASAAENPEPTSPKVTCIGQVRVKSKRRGRQHRRSISQRRTGEASFRRAEQLQEDRKNQRWVHLPASALRAFGSEFTCVLFPCRCSDCRFLKSKYCVNEVNTGEDEDGGCGAVLERWLMCCWRRGEIDAVLGDGDTAAEEEEEERMCVGTCRRHHVFDNIEVRNGRIEVRGRSLEVEEEEEEKSGRVSICIPPKNALLLMRCRSDPTKMAALANRYCNWEYTNNEDIEEEEEEEEEEGEEEEEDNNYGEEGTLVMEKVPEIVFEDEMEGLEPEAEKEIQNEVKPKLENNFEEKVVKNDGEEDEEIKAKDEKEEEMELNISSFEALLDQENLDSCQERVEESHLSPSTHSEKKEEENDEASLLTETSEEEEEKEETKESTHEEDEKQEPNGTPRKLLENNKQEEEEEEEQRGKQVLPDCLLLMMCEPKLSMEVSKETWVRGADFIRWIPERPRKPAKASCDHHHHARGRPPLAADPKPKKPIPALPARKNDGLRHQPPRSSCSLPAAPPPMAGGTELRMGPFALTRCKSEPMRTAAAKLSPESCLWKDSGGVKLEAHGQATVGVGGAAGVGFLRWGRGPL